LDVVDRLTPSVSFDSNPVAVSVKVGLGSVSDVPLSGRKPVTARGQAGEARTRKAISAGRVRRTSTLRHVPR
jgi:hypothetical protein